MTMTTNRATATATTTSTPMPDRARSVAVAAPGEPAAGSNAAERGWLLVLALTHAALAGIPFLVLGSVFGFPDILREPAAVVLAKFDENQGTIRGAYYAFAMSSVLMIPLAVLLRRSVAPRGGGLSQVAVALGLAAGVTQTLGFIRWTILVPFLADTYADPATTPATREAVAVAYEFANRYLGMTIGEHLGGLFQGWWVLLVGVSLLIHGGAGRWFGGAGIVIAALLLAGTPEQFRIGFEDQLALATSIGSTAFPFWLIALGAWLVRTRPRFD